MPVVKLNEEARRRALEAHRAMLLEQYTIRLARFSHATLLGLLAVNILQKPGNTLTRFTVKG